MPPNSNVRPLAADAGSISGAATALRGVATGSDGPAWRAIRIAANLRDLSVGKVEPPAGEIPPCVAVAIAAESRTVIIGTVGGFVLRSR